MTSPPWPPPAGLHTHNVPATSSILTSYSNIHIDAPAEKVFDVLRKVGNYGNWNAFAPIARIEAKGGGNGEEGLLEVGDKFVYEVVMDPKNPTKKHKTSLIVTDFSTPSHPSTDYLTPTDSEQGSYATEGRVWRISWKNIGIGPKTERVTEVIESENEEGRCEHRTWECQGGLMARVVKSMFAGRIAEAFEGWGRDLKGYVEGEGGN